MELFTVTINERGDMNIDLNEDFLQVATEEQLKELLTHKELKEMQKIVNSLYVKLRKYIIND